MFWVSITRTSRPLPKAVPSSSTGQGNLRRAEGTQRDNPGVLSEYVRSQPDFFAVAPARAAGAIDVGAGVWLSPGMSNAYLIDAGDARIVVNTGMWFEAKAHKQNFDAVTTAPTSYIVLTQSHTDHIGGVGLFTEPSTQLVAHANNARCQADDHRIHGFRIRRSLPFFAAVMGQPGFVRGDDVSVPPEPALVEPDITFDDHATLHVGARTVELLSVPGGETTDSLVVWLPDDRVALVGNLFSALFGHFPNLVTVRGDRLRFALPFIESVQRVIDLEPEVLLLGHHGPLRGAARVRAECERVRDAVRFVHDATVDAMDRGLSVWEAMRTVRLPEHLETGQAYGRVDWSVRAIWEGYSGWFHQHSTLELYPVGPEHGWSDAVELAGGPDALAARAAALVAADPLRAIRLCEMALAVDGEHVPSLRVYADAHERLLAAGEGGNYWLTKWLEGEANSARHRLERVTATNA
jgi:alkyl sulfatase BDS1-like metallo-beta-lactamase superfamily hydrolase